MVNMFGLDYGSRIERFAYFDLDLNELAMRQHRILHNLKNKRYYGTIITITELTVPPVVKYGEVKQSAKYSLIIIASPKRLNKKEIAQVIDKSQSPPQSGVKYGKRWS